MNKVHVKLTPQQILTIYSYIFTIKAPSIGMDRDFNAILDKLGTFGVGPSEDGTQIVGAGLPKIMEIDFSKQELAALKYAISLRLTPDAKNDYQVPFGVARAVVWPLCRVLGIETDIRKALPAVPASDPNDEAGVKLDSQWAEETTKV